jgi:hypothetical protein
MPKMTLTAEEAKVIKSMRYDGEKMLEGWNKAIDAVILALDADEGIDGPTLAVLVNKIAELKK